MLSIYEGPLLNKSHFSLWRRSTWWWTNELWPAGPAQVGGWLWEGMPTGVAASTLLPTLLAHSPAGKAVPPKEYSEISKKGRCLRSKPWRGKSTRQLDRPDQPRFPDCQEPVQHVQHWRGRQLLHGQQLEEEQGWGQGCLYFDEWHKWMTLNF